MDAPIISILTQILDAGIKIAPFLIGVALMIAGGVMALGNHQRGREGVTVALVGGAIMLGAKTIGTAIHV